MRSLLWKRNVVAVLTAAGSLWMAHAAQAVVLGTYSFDDQVGVAASRPNTSAVSLSLAGTIFSDFSRTGVSEGAMNSGVFESYNWPTGALGDNHINLGEYASFSFEAATDYSFELDSLSFSDQRHNLGPLDGQVRMSTDNFATFQSYTIPKDNPGAVTWNFGGVVVPTSFANVEFRFYAFDTNKITATNGWMFFDNVSLNGSTLAAPHVDAPPQGPADGTPGTAVPEPVTSMLAVMGLGALALSARRRRA